MCTKLMIQVELQEDDVAGQSPDSEMTFPAEVAFTTEWLDTPYINTNRSEVAIEKTFSHWTEFFNPSYLKVGNAELRILKIFLISRIRLLFIVLNTENRISILSCYII